MGWKESLWPVVSRNVYDFVTKTDLCLWVDVWPSFASFHDEPQTRQFGATKPDPKKMMRGSAVVRPWNDQTLPRNDQTLPRNDQTLPWFQKCPKIIFWFQMKTMNLLMFDLVGYGKAHYEWFIINMCSVNAFQVSPHYCANCAIPQRRLHPMIPSWFFMETISNYITIWWIPISG